MQRQPVTDAQRDRITAGVTFVEGLARRVAASMPHSIDLGDLVQDGMIGLIDAAHRFDESRGIKFETFAERRVRGAMIDALRRDAWPRGVRRMRRQLETAREDLRRELGSEPSMADLAARVGSDEARLSRTIVRINTIESTSPMSTADSADEGMLPAVLLPSEPPAPDRLYEQTEAEGPRPRRHRDAASARAPDHRPLLLRRSHDEADRRRDWRQRIAGVAVARSRDAAAAQGLVAAGAGGSDCVRRGRRPQADGARDAQRVGAGAPRDCRGRRWPRRRGRTTPAPRARAAASRPA